MNAQNQHFVNTQGFRISVIAFLAVVALAGAAFWFGTRLRADTAPSVAPSPLGSSLSNVRGNPSAASRLEDRFDRMNSSRAARSSETLPASFYGGYAGASAARSSETLPASFYGGYAGATTSAAATSASLAP